VAGQAADEEDTMTARWFDKLRMRWQMLTSRARAAKRLDDELTFHLEQQVQENLAAGMNAEEARYAALRSFGNPAALRDQARDTWSWTHLESLLRDLRIGIRTLRRTPGFAIVAILIMALGIGANVALFTIVRSVLLKPLPFPGPAQLVELYGTNGQEKNNIIAAGDFRDWQTATSSFAQMALWRWSGFSLTDNHGDLPELVDAAEASWNLVATLGVEPALGRSFTASDDRSGAPRTVILGWALYQRRFHGDPSILGHTIHLNTEPYTVIGVLPEWFTYPDPQIQMWVPIRLIVPPELMESHVSHSFQAIARLKAGTTMQRAVDELSAVQHQTWQRLNTSGPVAAGVAAQPLLEDLIGDIKTPLYVLLGAVGCLLLIACLNLANLMVARSAARRKEMAIRAALGGSRWRLCREQLTESLLICVAGGLLGLALGAGTTRWLVVHWRQMPRGEAVHIDGTVILFAIAITAVASLLAGLLPALSATGRGILKAMHDASRTLGGSAHKAWLRKVLLTVEIALTVVLLVAAGLLFRSFVRLRTVDLGCNTKNILTMNYHLRGQKYKTPEQIIAFHSEVLERVRHLPGVEASGLTAEVPGGGYSGETTYQVAELPPQDPSHFTSALFRTADPGYFHAMGIPFVQGRGFTDDERLQHDKYVIINQQFVRESFPNQNPLGKHLQVHWRSSAGEEYEIIGVVRDTLWSAQGELLPMMWFPILSGIPNDTTDAVLVVHTASNAAALAMPIQKQFAALDREMPVAHVLTMDERMGNAAARSSFSAQLVLSFAMLSLLLAAIGLYGVLAYLVAQRTTEIGIRIALGAGRGDVLRRVLLDGLRPAMLGLALGIGGSLAAAQLIQSVLYRTSPLDPAVFVTVSVTLVAVAAAACALPAWRASRLDPMQALRTE
jgi:predicted permease